MFCKTRDIGKCNEKCFFNGTLCPFETNIQSCSFDGVDEYVDCGNFNPTGDSDKQMSISFWAKGDIGGAYAITKYDYGLNQRAFFVGFSSSNFIFYVSDDGTDGAGHRKFYKDPTDYTDNAWHCFAVTFNGNLADDSAANRRMKLYVDGNRIDDSTLTKTNDDDITTIFNSNAQVLIGARENNNVAVDFFNGNIDEVSIWNKESSQYDITEIHEQYKTCCPFACNASSNLVSIWRMGDGDTHPTIYDYAGTNDATMINMDSSNFVEDTL